jgi:phosphatidylinositol dimannoside acyltransferase
MSVNLQQIINSQLSVSLVSILGRVIPPPMGFAICDFLGTLIASRRDSPLTRAVRTNQWLARGARLEKRELDRAVLETLRNNARDIYTLYHNIQHPQRVQRMVVMDSRGRELINRAEFAQRGLVVVGLHLSNFDLILQSSTQQGFKAMTLTIPNPQGGRRVEYEMRKRVGMNLVPTSLSTLKQAVQHLECGGTVLTGLDHPVQDPKHCPTFFGYPASLPTHHIWLALKAKVPVVIMATVQQGDGKYHQMSSDPIEMEYDADPSKIIVRNAERVLKQAEMFIQMAPQQWNVPLPVWPELLDVTPG